MILFPWKHKETNKRWDLARLETWAPVFSVAAHPALAAVLFFPTSRTCGPDAGGETQPSQSAPAVCLLRPETVRRLRSRRGTNGALNGSAIPERREKLSRQVAARLSGARGELAPLPQRKVGPLRPLPPLLPRCSAQLGRATARFAEQMEVEKAPPPLPSLLRSVPDKSAFSENEVIWAITGRSAQTWESKLSFFLSLFPPMQLVKMFWPVALRSVCARRKRWTVQSSSETPGWELYLSGGFKVRERLGGFQLLTMGALTLARLPWERGRSQRGNAGQYYDKYIYVCIYFIYFSFSRHCFAIWVSICRELCE